MARRKPGFLSDGSDSDASASNGDEEYNSQDDGDSRAERALFEFNGRKRRKTGGTDGKAAAWEGIFGEEGEEDSRPRGRGAPASRGRGGPSRTDWTKAPSFVPKTDAVSSGSHPQPDPPTATEQEFDPLSEEDDNDEEESDFDKADGAAASPRIRDEEDEDDEPNGRLAGGSRGGIGSGGSARGGIGLSRTAQSVYSSEESTPGPSTATGGLGSSNAPPNPIAEAVGPSEMPTTFGRPVLSGRAPPRPQSSFMGRQIPVNTATQAQLTASERAHFNSISGGFGAKFLSKLGWEAGKGLGAQEDGRAVPVAVGPQMRGTGIRSGIRTEDSKREARRRGEQISDKEDEEPRRASRKGKGLKARVDAVDDGWRKHRKIKVKVEHKTYEQILAEAVDQPAAGIGLVLDARGGELKEVSSLSALSLSSWTPTSDTTQLPELRHNLRLIGDIAKGDVDALAREGKSVHERRRWALREEQIARNKIEEMELQLARLENIQILVSTISDLMAKSTQSLAPFTEDFSALITLYEQEYDSHQLDDIVVGAIGQVMRTTFADWEPFDLSSDLLLTSLIQWRKAYSLPRQEEDRAITLNVNDHKDTIPDGERLMTAWESLLWSLWLPKVRSAINNQWKATAPNDAVHLLESWGPILPAFIHDNLIDQLILPKVKKAVEDWDARPARGSRPQKSLAGIVFPWLPLLGSRVEEVLEGAKRRIRSVMRNWIVKDGVPDELSRWKKDVYPSSEWDKLVLQYVVPKLGMALRQDFTINPANQDMVLFSDCVMPWSRLLRSSVFSHLLEVEFFPKWLDTLFLWLVHPGYKPDEVATWFTWWKSQFPEPVLAMRGVEHGFNKGLELMNEAMQLGTKAPNQLRKPVFTPLATKSSSKSSRSTTPIRKPVTTDPVDITFRSLAEDYAGQHDLIFLPLGRSDPQTGKPLLRVSKGVDGKKGVTVFIGQDAVFAQDDSGGFRAVSLDEMVKRASG